MSALNDFSEEAFMKTAPFTVFAMLMACAMAYPVRAADTASSSMPRPGAPVDEATFGVLDIDRDGYLSRLEVRRGTNLERMFDQLDANRDGRLSREELRGLYAVEMPGDVANRR